MHMFALLQTFKYTPLHIAVIHGHEQVVVELLRNGANPDCMSDVGYYYNVNVMNFTFYHILSHCSHRLSLHLL